MNYNFQKILGIETSCDETGAALLERIDKNRFAVISNHLSTSLAKHAKTGGIIPENAAREQLKYILSILDENLKENGLDGIDAIAVTYGPGLIGSLLVGVETARTISYVTKKPVLPINHMYGHIYANFIHDISSEKIGIKNIIFPAIALVVSGGHTDLLYMETINNIVSIGGTRDDAAGEAFDKIGRLIGINYPAGSEISRLAKNGNSKAFNLPRPMINSSDFDFSFSGLKTAVLNETKRNTNLIFAIKKFNEEGEKDNKYIQDIYDLCASVEEAVTDCIVKKTIKAIEQHKAFSLLIGGGVAANDRLREKLADKLNNLSNKNFCFSYPEKKYCTDNGAMIAAAGFFTNPVPWYDIKADPELYY